MNIYSCSDGWKSLNKSCGIFLYIVCNNILSLFVKISYIHPTVLPHYKLCMVESFMACQAIFRFNIFISSRRHYGSSVGEVFLAFAVKKKMSSTCEG